MMRRTVNYETFAHIDAEENPSKIYNTTISIVKKPISATISIVKKRVGR